MIIIDDREQKSGIPKKLESHNVEIELKHMETGDYHIIARKKIFLKRMTEDQFNDVVNKAYDLGDETNFDMNKLIDFSIERKSDDFIISVMSQRLEDQLYRNSLEFYRSILLIEGGLAEKCVNYGYKKRYGFPIESAWGAIVNAILKVAYDGGAPISVIFTENASDTARFLRKLDENAQKAENYLRYRPAYVGVKVKKNSEKEEQQLHDRRAVAILCTFSNIKETRAVKLLKHFGSPKAVFMATAEQIAEVDGFSLKFAKSFIEELETEFKGINGDYKNGNGS